METLEHCPVCGNKHFKPYKTVRDYTVSQNNFEITQCDSCAFLFTNPRPAENEIGTYYQSQDYISHHDEATDLMSKVYTSVRDYTLQQKAKLVKRLQPKTGRLLDIGCGTGNFAAVMKQNNWEIYGTEPDEGARQIAAKRTNAIIAQDIFQSSFGDKKFDIISLWHVLEHIHRLDQSLDWIEKHLTGNGNVIIAVPNPESEDAKKYGEYWAAYDVPRHLYHFTKNTMSQLLKNHGLAVKEILPMWFDSFYVSMLSSKYKSGNTELLSSFSVGAISNWKGRKTSGAKVNTSSLIYIIGKK